MNEPVIGVRIVPEGMDLSAETFLNAAHALVDLLEEVDRNLTEDFRRTFTLSLRTLQYGSPAVLMVEPVGLEDRPDNRSAVIDVTTTGISELEQSGDRPDYFTDQALQYARRLSLSVTPGVRAVELIRDGYRLSITEALAAHVRSILGDGREILGSVDGRLEVLSSHGTIRFAIYEPVVGRRIQCAPAESEADRLLRILPSLWNSRVRVTGRLRTNRRGQVTSATIYRVEPLPGSPTLSTEELVGITDLTEGRDAVEHVRRLWSDD